MSARRREDMPAICRPEMGDFTNLRDYHRARDPGRTPKKDGFFTKAKDWLEGKSPADADRRGPQRTSNGPRSHQPNMMGSILLPRLVLNDPRNMPASSSHGDRNGSGEADVYKLRPPSPGSNQDDDSGPSPKDLVMAVMEVKSAVNRFAKVLISDMDKFPEDLKHLNLAIRDEVQAEVDRANHWKFLVQAFVCRRLFEGFETENGFFGIEYFDGDKMSSCSSFMDFSNFKDKAATISKLLAQDSADLSFLGKFCFKKFKSICYDLATNRSLPIYEEDWSTVARGRHPKSEFYQSFLKVAVSVWLLHRLVHSFEQGWSMLGWDTYPKGSEFQRRDMESVVPSIYFEEEDEGTDLNIEVGFLVLPGFVVSNSVVKCAVYLVPSHQSGRVDKNWVLAVSNQNERRSRRALRSHGDRNALESISQDFSQLFLTHGSTSTPVSQAFSEPSPAWELSENIDQAHEPKPTDNSSSMSGSSLRESSELTPANKAGSNGLEGKPQEIPNPLVAGRTSEPLVAGSTSDTLDGRPHKVSEPSPTQRSSSSSGSTQHVELSPVIKSSDSIIEDVVKKYTWDQVLDMTNGLTSSQLGKGGFGAVYLGMLENRKEVAVKILDPSSHQGIPEFLNEVNLLNRVNHVNLVRLLGYCQDEKRVLIYEFAEEGSIWDHLHGEGKRLDWKQRLNIALQSACGLEYLHTGCTPRIIHRDIKSQNILLTKHMVAKVADFGVSRLVADQDNNWKTHVTTKVMGTLGYLDPDYIQTGVLRDSSDVYSFGIVLLEIVTGRKPVPNKDSKCCIGNWVEKNYGSGGSRALKAVADPALGGEYNPKALKLVINVARSCTLADGTSRPKISEVVRVLRKAVMVEDDERKSWLPF